MNRTESSPDARTPRARILTPNAAAAALGLDGDRGAAWLIEQANRYRIDHVRHGNSVYFVAEDLAESIAWLWWLSDHVGATERHRLRVEAFDDRIAMLDRDIASAPPSLRICKALENRGHRYGIGQYVRAVDVDQASALGCDVGEDRWPVEIRAGQVDASVAMALWFRMPEAARRKAARTLCDDPKGATRGQH
ncbi:MAG: hypothetical protein JNL80_00245 [Phycisphaerae bacterium]|nr:hypothetical protein [Phycisphaerae bacterium]